MKIVSVTRFQPLATALLLAGGMCLIPFLQPRHLPPIRAFYDEWLAFAFGLAAIAFATGTRKRAPTQIPALAVFVGLFALYLVVRAICVRPIYPQSSLLWGLYSLFAALIILLGRDLSTWIGQDRVCDVLAAFFLAGALANSVAGVLQVVGIPREIDSFISYLQGKRAVGNVGQSNLYANYLALGQASLVYLFTRGKIGRWSCFAGGLLLVGAGALAASRATPLYSIGFAVLACVAVRRSDDSQMRKLATVTFVLAASVLLAQWFVPFGMNLHGFHLEGGFQRDVVSEWTGPVRDESTHLRLVAWEMAWRLFESAPWIGVGPDAFAGASFARGLPREMSVDAVWTSPHNLLLHLLAETGLIGTSLVCAGLFIAFRQSGEQYFRLPSLARWWLLACASVEFLHALLEYSLLYSHFLAITALIMGVGAVATPRPFVRAMTVRALYASSAFAGALILGSTLAGYLQFEKASPVIAGQPLASDSEMARDRDSLARLSTGLLAPRAELWLFLAFPLNDAGVGEKVALGERVLRYWPSVDVVVRQSIFLALAGRHEEAVSLLKKGVGAFGSRTKRIAETIRAAPRNAREALREVLPPENSQ